MKDLPPHNSKTSSGPTPPRRGGELCSGLCASRSRAKKSRRTRLPLRGFWAKKKRLAALPKRSKTFNIKRMHFLIRAPLLLLAGFLLFGGAPRAVAEEAIVAEEETLAQKALREANEEAAKARAAGGGPAPGA